jgi:NADPH:quinone reductase-like Zn-dependent oxidoreductase
MEISQVRRRVQAAIAAARSRTQERRQLTDAATKDYSVFLETVATPLVQQIANALKAEGHSFTVSTPGDGLRIEHDRGRDNFVEFTLDTTGDRPQVIGRVSQTRGSRRLDDERPIKPDALPSEISEDDVLEFVIRALEPWLGR